MVRHSQQLCTTLLACALALSGLQSTAHAQTLGGSGMQSGASAEAQSRLHAERGPRKAAIAGGGELQVPAGVLFLKRALATRVAAERQFGDDNELQAMLLPADEKQNWCLQIFTRRSLSAHRMIFEGVSASQLQQTVEKGLTSGGVEIVRWPQTPSYDPARKLGMWGVVVRHEGQEMELWNAYFGSGRNQMELSLVGPASGDSMKRVFQPLIDTAKWTPGPENGAEPVGVASQASTRPSFGSPSQGGESDAREMGYQAGVATVSMIKLGFLVGVPFAVVMTALGWLATRGRT